MKIETLSVDFTDEQKRYLEGFATGLQISKVGRGLGGNVAAKTSAEPSGPDAAHIKAPGPISRERSGQPRCCGNPSWTTASGHLRRLAALQHTSCVPSGTL